MRNFDYHNPTRIVFGRKVLGRLKNLTPRQGAILLVTGGEALRKNGVHGRILEALSGREVVEFSGIRPNPEYDHLMEGAALARSSKAVFIVAAGGGSVMDGAKFIAAASRSPLDDPWDICARHAKVVDAVPLGVVATLPATGSETNNIGVISRASVRKKIVFHADAVFPRFAIMDPEITFSLPEKQIRNGVVDAFVHVLEQYLTYPEAAPLQDRQAEAILLTLQEVGLRTLVDRSNYDVRASFMWCANQALNGLLKCGVPTDFATHRIAHEITVLYGLAHAEAISVILFPLLRHQKRAKHEKLIQYARRVWSLDEPDADQAVEQALRETESFFNLLGMPTRLKDHGVSPEEAARIIRGRLEAENAKLGERGLIGPNEAAEIIQAA